MIKRPKQREKSNSGDHYISGFQTFLTTARSKKYILHRDPVTNAVCVCVCVCVCIQVQREFTGQRIVFFIFFISNMFLKFLSYIE